MATGPTLSTALRVGRRALEGLTGVDLLEDWHWESDEQKWALHCRLTVDITPTDFLPAVTEWHLLVDPSYPWGSVKLYPNKEHGPNVTFPHQLFNSYGKTNKPWRTGELCVSTSLHVLGRPGLDVEPYEANQRLCWHLERALEWLVAASKNDLVREGEPFELPEFPNREGPSISVAFAEGPDTYSNWQNITEGAGLVEFFDTTLAKDYFIVGSFLSRKKEVLWKLDWGNALSCQRGSKFTGIWLRLGSPPVLKPWQAPICWGELRQTLHHQNINLDELMRPVLEIVRDGRAHFALIGFPTTDTVGSPPIQMHWQAMILPVLSWGTQTAPGFRTNETGRWQRDRTELLTDKIPLSWATSENWHPSQLTSRGSLPNHITSAHILVIGAGSVGSAVAELLARAGVSHLTIIDGETLVVENLVRHSLLLGDVGKYKAEQLVTRLNAVSPHANVEAINSKFPPTDEKSLQKIQQTSIIVDCSASDEVLNAIENFTWNGEKIFLSISLGMKARRLFCFAARGATFSHTKFRDLMGPWLSKEAEESSGLILPREGVGCWHPVFPARIDDVSMLTALAVKQIEEMALRPLVEPELSVFETRIIDSNFAGVMRVQG